MRHIERCRLLLHIVDGSGLEGDPVERIKIINEEIKKYSDKTGNKRQILCINKIDIASKENIEKIEKYAKKEGLDYILISAVTTENIEKLVVMIADKLEKIPNEPLVDIEKIYELKDEEEEISVEKIILKKGIKLFKVSGKLATRIMGRVNIADNESMYFLHKTLEETGITSKLEKLRNRRRRFNRNCRLWIWVVYVIKRSRDKYGKDYIWRKDIFWWFNRKR